MDLGPIGKIYPSCSSGWYEKEEDIKLADVKPQLYFRAGEEVEGAIKAAKLVWAKASDEEEDSLTTDPSPSGEGSENNGGGGGGTGSITPSGGGDNGGGAGFESEGD